MCEVQYNLSHHAGRPNQPCTSKSSSKASTLRSTPKALTIWLPSARKRFRPYGCPEPEFRRLFLSRFDIAKMAAVCLLNIPGLFLTDFDRVFSVVRPVKRRFLQKKRLVRSSITYLLCYIFYLRAIL